MIPDKDAPSGFQLVLEFSGLITQSGHAQAALWPYCMTVRRLS